MPPEERRGAPPVQSPQDPGGSSALIDLQGEPALILDFAGSPLPPIARPGHLVQMLPAWRPDRAPASMLAMLPRFPAGVYPLHPDVAALRPRHAIVNTIEAVEPWAVMAALLYGCETFHCVEGDGHVFRSRARGALPLALSRSGRRLLDAAPVVRRISETILGRRLVPLPAADLTTSAAAEVAFLEWAAWGRGSRLRPFPATGRLRVMHYIGQLGPGGAERQLTYLAGGTRARGHDVRVLTAWPCVGEHEDHYAPALARAGVPWLALRPAARDERLPGSLRGLRARLPRPLIAQIERHCGRHNLLPLLDVLLRDPPDVLHCWLDEPNLVGALAGLIAGVPRILISARNVSPAHMPRLDVPWFRDSYARLASSPRVTFLANSRAGADDYARWCGISPARFEVVYNGFPADECPPLTDAARRQGREALGLPADAFLIVSAFRLHPEKRPLEFVRVVAAARARLPRLQVLHVGAGPLEPEVRELARELGVGGTLRLLGRREDPWSVMGLGDASLLCSEAEGCPNVALEAQALGVPMVLTAAGGAAETVLEGETGFVRPVGDVDGLAGALVALASDEPRRRAMADRAPAFVRERFSIEAMVTRSLSFYRDPARGDG